MQYISFVCAATSSSCTTEPKKNKDANKIKKHIFAFWDVNEKRKKETYLVLNIMISALKEAKNELVFVKFYVEYLIYEMVLGDARAIHSIVDANRRMILLTVDYTRF